MDIKKIEEHYQAIIDKNEIELTRLKNTIFRVGTLRLIVVLACAFGIYFFWGNGMVIGLMTLITAILFGGLLKYHNKLFKEKKYCEVSITDAQNELKGLNYDFSAFDGASEKIDADHSYSLDLDLFGKRSFFQSINRTVTSFGKDCLADSFIFPLKSKEEILLHQEAVTELASKIDLSTHFRTVGGMSDGENIDLANLKESFAKPSSFYGNKFWAVMLYLVPASYLVLGILCMLDLASTALFVPLWIGLLIFSSLPLKKTNNISAIFDKNTAVLEAYSELFDIVEKNDFDNQLLKDNQAQLRAGKASQSIKALKSYHNNLIQSMTFPVMLFFNPVLLWNVNYAYKIEKWMHEHKEDIGAWFAAIAKFDSLVSMAVFAYNHPDYINPTPADSFQFVGKELGHPLINRAVCVRNDVSIHKNGYFLVITGANMAGKSTYLRTIGINHTLACAGAPVCAESLTFYPGRLVTNLRTADSLADNESYFFAELKRLKMIIDRLQSGEELFIILDEILKGTNSQDKQKGSIALMRQLISLQANGIIATHDLVLGDLEKEYPENVKDYRFEADIENEQLSFTYKLREGVAQNMNACFLMRKMGITGIE